VRGLAGRLALRAGFLAGVRSRLRRLLEAVLLDDVLAAEVLLPRAGLFLSLPVERAAGFLVVRVGLIRYFSCGF
jgi:hypothetical protein